MTIHPEGRRIILTVFVSLTLICILITFFVSPIFLIIISAACLFLVLFIMYFFRHPNRIVEPSGEILISPADGKIIIKEPAFEKEYFKKEMMKVSIFMSVYDVHLNRVPVDGEVVYQKYHPGKYLLAINPKASELNERNTVVIRNDEGKEVLIRQIAGGVARRIRPYLTLKQTVRRGDELGFIRFGSRVDIFLPLTSEITVEIGEMVKGNINVLARLK